MTYKTTFETKARTIDVLDVALVGAVGPEGKPKPFTQILELFPGMSRTTLKDCFISLQRMGYVKLQSEGRKLLIETVREPHVEAHGPNAKAEVED